MWKTLRALGIGAAVALAVMAGGCASYTTPGRRADLSSVGLTEQVRKGLSDPTIQQTLDRKPLPAFPTSIAIARLQAAGYHSCSASGWGEGRYSIVTSRDVEKDEQFARLAKLPKVQGIAPMNRLLLPQHLENDLPLRQAAAKLHADMLLIYSFDTTFYDNQFAQPLNVITLGLSPTKTINVTTTASAILMDTRNGYLYGLAEGTASRNKLTNAWMSSDAMDDARQKNEQEAFEKLIVEFEKTWTGVVNQYAIRAAAPSGQTYKTE